MWHNILKNKQNTYKHLINFTALHLWIQNRWVAQILIYMWKDFLKTLLLFFPATFSPTKSSCGSGQGQFPLKERVLKTNHACNNQFTYKCTSWAGLADLWQAQAVLPYKQFHFRPSQSRFWPRKMGMIRAQLWVIQYRGAGACHLQQSIMLG